MAFLYCALSVLFTWPLVVRLNTGVGGDELDPWQTLWGFWWLRHWRDFGQTLFATRMLWWPTGASLWFQTWDLPSAAFVWSFGERGNAFVAYNVAVLATFPLAGIACYLVCRELSASPRASFIGGCLYTFSIYHSAHARMQLHIASMEWAPLFFWAALRAINRDSLSYALAAGVALSAALFSSSYTFLFCVLLLPIAVVHYLTYVGPSRPWWRPLAGVSLGSLIFVVLAGWLIHGLALEYLNGPFVGGHDPIRFSADIEGLVIPNGVSIWSSFIPRSQAWTGNPFESANYVGLGPMLLTFVAWRLKPAKPYIALALAGLTLSLGWYLHVGGHILDVVPLPERWLELLVPPLQLSGLPTRYSWLSTFGVSIASALALDHLTTSGTTQRTLAAALVSCLCLVELIPGRFPISLWSRPAVLNELASVTGDWAVLDSTGWSRSLWNQMAHKHPIIAGYTTRTTRANWARVNEDPVVAQFFRPPLGRASAMALSPRDIIDGLRGWNIRYLIVGAH